MQRLKSSELTARPEILRLPFPHLTVSSVHPQRLLWMIRWQANGHISTLRRAFITESGFRTASSVLIAILTMHHVYRFAISPTPRKEGL